MLNTRKKVAQYTHLSPPGPRNGLFPERLIWAFRRNPLQFLSGLARDYGDIVLARLGRQSIYLLNHPDFIREALVTKEADFTGGLVNMHTDSISLNQPSAYGCVADLRLVEALRPLSVTVSQLPFKELVIEQTAQFTLGWRTGQAIDLQAQMEQLTSQIAHKLLAELAIPIDLREQAERVVKGGQIAVAQALVSTFLLLTGNPVLESQAHTEARSIFTDINPSSVNIQRLIYTRMLLTETLRLYPPVWAIQRQALRDATLGGYTIPAGAIVWISPWVVQHDPRFFPDPWRFDPERWSAELLSTRRHFCYIPFGAGPRRCLGEGFAWLQGILILALLLQDWKFEALSGHQPALPGREYANKPEAVSLIVLKGR